MMIEVELFGQLLPCAERRQSLNLESPVTVGDVAALLGIQAEEIGIISINGVQSEMDDTVPPDCRLCFFPPLSGG
jgi:molybdopterin converting factor small subunit